MPNFNLCNNFIICGIIHNKQSEVLKNDRHYYLNISLSFTRKRDSQFEGGGDLN
jgi:hypothetical protein